MSDVEGPLLTRPTKYNIEDSNIALLGSDLEKKVREHAGDKETAWDSAGQTVGTQIWRIEKFGVVEWPKERYGSFYDGDCYIVLHTYKKTPEAEELSYDLHFWIGGESSQDEAGTAAYKTVELDDHLNEKPVQYREIQGFESSKFLSYFPHFVSLHGGISTGFHHVSSPPPDNAHKFYRVTATGTRLIVREVPAEGASLVPGDAYILDMGTKVWQFNSKGSVGKERFKAAEFVQTLVNERGSISGGAVDVTVYDEGGHGAGIFLSEIGLESVPITPTAEGKETKPPALFRLSDASGKVTFESVEPTARSTLSPSDAFLLDDIANETASAVYVWIGSGASLTERRIAVQYGQAYLYSHENGGRKLYATSIVKIREGHEPEAFLRALGE
ncbi:fragmin60 [Irpex rosettiformis]|uniref:Fragmin60 n=1 Tax=Irpex rosettiformis TaxID=378272 RepID=A0ACB8U0S2_9APHY|nr:fragmin60 [Irpex rosettiformis]